MSQPCGHIGLFVDLSAVRDLVARPSEPPPKAGGRGKKAAEAAETGRPIPGEMARALLRYALQLGRVSLARAYGDWAKDAVTAREFAVARFDAILVPGPTDGPERGVMRLAVDAMTALYAGGEPDAFVLVTRDGGLLPLVQALRADGREVVLVAPAGATPEDLKGEADRFVTLEDALAGAAAEPIVPRPARAEAPDEGPEPRGRAPMRASEEPAAPRRERVPHPTPVRTEEDLDRYDWGPFVRLIDELEHRLPFVGVRYLVNKVIGFHNCGVEDPRLKRDLINRAMDDGLIEMYPVGNLGDRADPVTACRLDRANAAVVAVLGETSSPERPPESHAGAEYHAESAPTVE